MSDATCDICGAAKVTSVPTPLCAAHAAAFYQGVLSSHQPPKTRRRSTQGLRSRPATGSKYLTERDRLDAHNARQRAKRRAR